MITKKTKSEIKLGNLQGSAYWRLTVTIENKPTIQAIKVYTNSLENKAIWEAIEANEYLGKRYDLQCRNWKGNYYLINWKELGLSYSEED